MPSTPPAGAQRHSRKKRNTWARVNQLRHQRRVQNIVTFGLVVLGPVLVVATYLVLGPLNLGSAATALRLVLLADLIYVLSIAALVMQRVARMIAARRARSAGSRLHLRLTGVFAIVALIPTILVAVFATLTVNIGLEGWFSDRVRQVVGNSLAAAEAYEQEHRDDLRQDAESLAAYLNVARQATFLLSDGNLRQLLTQGQARIQRGLREAYVIDGTGEIRARGERSYLFDYELPSRRDFTRATEDGIAIIEDWRNNEFRALVALEAFNDRYLYVSREVDGQILNLLDDTQETVRLYQQLENERGRVLFEFGLLYLGFAVILMLAAIWLGLWFAERLSRPVGRLTSAAQRVGDGDLNVQVMEEDGDDEIAMLGRIFNKMTRQLKGQRETLLESNRQIERRRRLFDSVLSSITAGVIGLDSKGRIDFVNRSAAVLLDLEEGAGLEGELALVVPEFSHLLEQLRAGQRDTTQEEIKLTRHGKRESLLVRMSVRVNAKGRLEGYVVAFDDVTDLVSAQRMAAWGDVARRIAHEIKNPLTPIQLSAERLKRKFAPRLGEDGEALAQMTDVIIRQTNDLRRIVDEFSKFARMPEPERREHDILELIRGAVLLQRPALEPVRLNADIPDGTLPAVLDATMISQALTNLIKNAGEAIESLVEKGAPEDYDPEVRVAVETTDQKVVIRISDNGIGLPVDRARLFEPYVTTREKGTGLGLPIVKKIIEEHGGTLELTDADPFGETAHRGAMAVVTLQVGAERAGVLKSA
ncbi:PAS domain-containing sensor histidine kinase [Brevirhabdus pacifica]|uniref:histidine kinase n=1 Tax=Brevirhabdus pacifica TaxID=1267768 RepID=A0A1U7DLN2_9RHOB|nr:PAS domain-containing sensor histidine kinase [Brevirhabdus pacifica]